jgi:hypothetical protein
MRRTAPALLASVIWVLFGAAAQAAIPQANLLANGDGESGIAVSDGTSHYCPQGWTCESGSYYGPDMTLMTYGSLVGFPTSSEGARIGGGKSFFVGGPNSARSISDQLVDLSAAGNEIDAGQVQYTLGGCLGGKADDPDDTTIYVYFYTGPPAAGGAYISGANKRGPSPAARDNKTQLLPVSTVAAVPARARVAQVIVDMSRQNGSYNDGSADNLSFSLGPIPGPAPAASTCIVPNGAGGSGGNPPSGDGKDTTDPGSGGGRELTSGVLAFGASARIGTSGKARIRVRCNTVEVKHCDGTLSLSLVGSSKSARSRVRLGTASYSVASGQTVAVSVSLRKADAKAISELPSRKLKRRRLRLTSRTSVGATRLDQTVRLKINRAH